MAWKSRLVLSLLVAMPMLAAGPSCAGGGGEGSETHFGRCTTDADCTVPARCENRVCVVRSKDASVDRGMPVVAPAATVSPGAGGSGGAPSVETGGAPSMV